MSTTLIATAALVGLAGAPHCAVMCGAPCAALTGARRSALASLLATRTLGYIAVGTLLAGSGSAIGAWAREGSAWTAGARALWIAMHAAALAWGLVMVLRGAQPRWASDAAAALQRALRPRPPALALATGEAVVHGPGHLRAGAGPAALAGSLWWAWPCGLLQSAFVLAALGSSAGDGAATMAAFALTSGAGLWAGPRLWRRFAGDTGRAQQGERVEHGLRWAVRAAGVLLTAAAAVALWHDARGAPGLLCW